jgi:hypothetical protein
VSSHADAKGENGVSNSAQVSKQKVVEGLPAVTEGEWLSHLELKFVLRAHKMELLRALGRYIGGGAAEVQNANHIFIA